MLPSQTVTLTLLVGLLQRQISLDLTEFQPPHQSQLAQYGGLSSRLILSSLATNSLVDLGLLGISLGVELAGEGQLWG